MKKILFTIGILLVGVGLFAQPTGVSGAWEFPAAVTIKTSDLTLTNGNFILKSGAEISFDSDDVTLTHSANTLTVGGGDLADGLSDGNAWETITKVNAVWVAKSFAPGDSILFNRGDTFYGGLVAGEDGTSGNYISIGSYGSGANPIITGFTTLSDWTDGGGTVSAKGVVWSTTPDPSVSDDKTDEGGGTDNFTSSVTGLTRNTVYYLKAYATNETGTGYGTMQTFRTPRYKVL